jgi:hypothetical protein
MSQLLITAGLRTSGGEGGIRTLGTGLNADVHVSYTDSIFYPETEGQHNGKTSAVQSKAKGC